MNPLLSFDQDGVVGRVSGGIQSVIKIRAGKVLSRCGSGNKGRVLRGAFTHLTCLHRLLLVHLVPLCMSGKDILFSSFGPGPGPGPGPGQVMGLGEPRRGYISGTGNGAHSS